MERVADVRPALPPIRVRIALAKSWRYTDLYSYSGPDASGTRSLIGSSNFRSGPIGLFVDFGAEYFILASPESAGNAIETEKQHRGYIRPHHPALQEAQRRVAIRPESVDWGRFDLVIAIEDSVPAGVTERYPATLWATLVEDHSLTAFSKYMDHPPTGYDCFLNQHFGPTPRSWRRKQHVIEWCYSYASPGCVRRLLPEVNKEDLVMIDAHEDLCEVRLSPLCDLPLVQAGGRSPLDHLSLLAKARFYLCPSPSSRRWGNALVEAASAGCVLVGNRRAFWNPCLITPDLHCEDYGAAARLVSRLRSDKNYYERALASQEDRLRRFVWERPFEQVRQYLPAIDRPLSIRNALL
jgi:hypothetical protein